MMGEVLVREDVVGHGGVADGEYGAAGARHGGVNGAMVIESAFDVGQYGQTSEDRLFKVVDETFAPCVDGRMKNFGKGTGRLTWHDTGIGLSGGDTAGGLDDDKTEPAQGVGKPWGG